MNNLKNIIGGILFTALMCIGFSVQAQTPNTANQNMMRNNVNMTRAVLRLETWTDRFEDSLSTAFDNNRVDNMELEDEVLALVKGFEYATDRFAERVEDNEVIAFDVENLLSRALLIEGVMSRVPASTDARSDWMQIKEELNRIAKDYKVAWVWTLEANPYWKNAAVEPIFDRLERRSDDFLNSFRYSLDFSKVNGTELEDDAIKLANQFEENMDMLETRTDNNALVSTADMDKVLKQALLLEAFMRTHNLPLRVQRDWAEVKASLKELATRSNVTWTWKATPVAASTKQ